MCSLDRIYAMLTLERTIKPIVPASPLTSLMARLHEADMTSRPHKDRALLCEAISRGCRGLGIADSAIRS